MMLQMLFSLYTLLPVGVVPASSSHSTITIHGSRTFTAEVFSPTPTLFESRYPGAVLIATDETRDRAFRVASRMAEIGVTVIMYTQETNATHRLLVYDAQTAIDSMRRRIDVRPEEVGVIAFEQATTVVPDLVRDTTLSFAIAASAQTTIRDLTERYARAHAATLLVQGIDDLNHATIPLTSSVTQGAGNLSASMLTPTEMQRLESQPVAPVQVAPNVTIWPVPKEQLEAMGEVHSPLSTRVVGWVKEQVHAAPQVQQQLPMSVH
jgi:hypothetical protein